MNETTATIRRRAISCQAPLCFTQPPQYRGRGREGPRNKDHPRRFSYRIYGHAEGLYRVVDYQGSLLRAACGSVPELDLCGVGCPLVLRARQHDDVGFTLQSGKHTCGILLSQDAEDCPQGTVAVRIAYPGERRRESRRVVPPVHHHGDALDLVYLKPSWKILPDIVCDLLRYLDGDCTSD